MEARKEGHPMHDPKAGRKPGRRAGKKARRRAVGSRPEALRKAAGRLPEGRWKAAGRDRKGGPEGYRSHVPNEDGDRGEDAGGIARTDECSEADINILIRLNVPVSR